MVFQEKTYSVLIVSASDSFTNSVMPLLPMTDYWPVATVGSVGQARRRLATLSASRLSSSRTSCRDVRSRGKVCPLPTLFTGSC